MLFMIGSAGCWGLASVIGKVALAEVPPMTLLVLQLLASISALWLATLLSGARRRPSGRDNVAAMAGLLEPGAAYAIGTVGLLLTSASSTSLISAAEPIIIILLGLALLRERATAGVVAAAFGTALGLALFVEGDEGGRASRLGDLLVLLATVSAALYVIVSARFGGALDPLHTAARQQTVGFLLAIALFGVGVALELERPAAIRWSWSLLLVVVGGGLVQYALAFWLYLLGLRHLPVNVAGLFLALTPVFGLGGAHAWLGETFNPGQLTGALIVVLAVAFGAWTWRRRAGPHDAS